MSKKKKSKKLKYYNSGKKNKKKSGKKNKTTAYKKPRYRDTKPSLTKKEAKANAKIVKAPVEIPKEFIKNRRKCNHAGELISVDAYKAITPNYAAYTPMLDQVVAQYGSDNVRICRSCFDVVVGRNEVSAGDMLEAMTTLYCGVNVAIANRRLKTDEIKELAKLKESLDDFRAVIEILERLEADGEDDSSSSSTSGNSVNPNHRNGAFVS